MRTTLTLDDDVAARLRQLDGFSSFEDAVNAILRAGLDHLTHDSSKVSQGYKIQAVDLEPIVQNVDNIAEILDLIED